MVEVLDLRGVPCPLSWAKTKVHLELLPPDVELIVRLDDAKGVRDLPRAAEAEGYAVVAIDQQGSEWCITLTR